MAAASPAKGKDVQLKHAARNSARITTIGALREFPPPPELRNSAVVALRAQFLSDAASRPGTGTS
jgi:hypothetical protein